MNRVNRDKKITVRLTSKELEKIDGQFNRSTCRDRSAYLRKVILTGKLTLAYRDRSMDDLIEELTQARRVLNAIGVNFNQLVKKLNGSKENIIVAFWAKKAINNQAELLGKVEEIKKNIASISDRWLQKL